MDGTEGLRLMYYQLHTVGKCMHSNVRIGKNYNFRIENICLMIVSYGILFMPPLVVVDIFVRISM